MNVLCCRYNVWAAGCLFTLGAFLWLVPNSFAETSSDFTISVPGIPGPYCMYGLEKRLLELEEVSTVDLLWDTEIIRVSLKEGKTLTDEQIQSVVTKADYPYDISINR